jgi:hypothetical protein
MTPDADAAVAEAERRGDPYLVYADAAGRHQVMSLPESWERVTVGRGLSADLVLSWDEDVSRIHAELQRLGSEWALVDDGLSRNGSYVNGARIDRRRLLLDGDVMRFGKTEIAFRAPFQAGEQTRAATQLGGEPPP